MPKRTAHDIIIKPIITEDSMRGIQDKKYVFRVCKDANKIEIKKALQELFDVKVEKVNTLNCKGRAVRYRQSKGYRQDWKKAIVKLCESSKTIEFFDAMY